MSEVAMTTEPSAKDPLPTGAAWEGSAGEAAVPQPVESQSVEDATCVWTVEDDILLCDAIEEGATLEALSHGVVKFSRSFTVQELSHRWRTLLYDPEVSIPAAERMARVTSAARPTLPLKKPLVKSLYEQSRASNLAEDGTAKEGTATQDMQEPPSFSDVELVVVQAERGFAASTSTTPSLQEGDNATASEASKGAGSSGQPVDGRELRGLQSRWQARTRRKDVLAISELERTSMAATSRMLSKAGTLAVLRGTRTYFEIKKPEVIVGRSTEQQLVDIDLAKEGSATKVSRQQARIKLSHGVFKLINVGRRPIFVNNSMVESGYQRQLEKNALVEVGGLRFLFQINSRNMRRLMRQ
mmetsp:Transcript_8695/g.18018  ORF Transcript_8695/g.18018 Transcript_8695/m.18018 type:complete len:356 (-) Transcript_8695:160-1227(-)